MKILLCGSRNLEIKNKEFVFKTLNDIISKEQYFREIANKDLEVVSGNNPKGADYLCEQWAKSHNLKLTLFPAEWTNEKPKKPDNWGNIPTSIWKPDFWGGYNSLAGYIRNQIMANYCIGEICIAFDAEEKRGNTGTRDMIKRAKKQWMKVYHIKCSDLENVEVKIYNEGLQKE